MNKLIIFFSFLVISINAQSQVDSMSAETPLPYFNIPEYPSDFSSGNIISRMVDGLGYRYYWATQGLHFEDMTYKISEGSRTIKQTLTHISQLARTIDLVANNQPIIRSGDDPEYTFDELRERTLEHIESASGAFLGLNEEEISKREIVFQRADRTSSFPIWNLLNGQLADAIYHTGQVVGYRRAAGNPVDPRMNVFSGKTRE